MCDLQVEELQRSLTAVHTEAEGLRDQLGGSPGAGQLSAAEQDDLRSDQPGACSRTCKSLTDQLCLQVQPAGAEEGERHAEERAGLL